MEQQLRVGALFDEVATTYDNVGVAFFQPIAERLVAELDPQPGECTLDVGCGRGAVLCALGQRVGASGTVIGIDMSPRMIAEAKKVAVRAGVIAEIRVGDAMAPDLPSNSLDVVSASLVLFFLPDPLGAIRAWHGLLVPGGRIGVSTFGPYDERWATGVEALFRAYAPNRDAGQPTPFGSDEAMEALLTEAGYQGIRTARSVVSPRFDDGEHWFRWSMSHGQRQFWQTLPENRRIEAKIELCAAVEECRDEHGRVGFDQHVRYTLGAR